MDSTTSEPKATNGLHQARCGPACDHSHVGLHPGVHHSQQSPNRLNIP
jgi:hypothetical protein